MLGKRINYDYGPAIKPDFNRDVLGSIEPAGIKKLRSARLTVTQQTVSRSGGEALFNAGIITGACPDAVEPIHHVRQFFLLHLIHIQYVQTVHIWQDTNTGEGESLSRQPWAIDQSFIHLFQRLVIDTHRLPDPRRI